MDNSDWGSADRRAPDTYGSRDVSAPGDGFQTTAGQDTTMQPASAPPQPAFAPKPVYTPQPAYTSPQQPAYTSPQQPAYTSPTQPAYTSPTQPAYTSPTQPAYTPQRSFPPQGGGDDWRDEHKQAKKRRRKTVIIVLGLVTFFVVTVASVYVWIMRFAGGPDEGQPSASESRSQSESSSGQESFPSQSGSGEHSSQQSSQQSSQPSETLPSLEINDMPANTSALLTIPEIYAKLSPSVVMIIADLGGGSSAMGTGIVMTEDGYIITNQHVIADALDVSVILSDNTTTYTAVVIGEDANSDIAVLKVDEHGFVPAEFGDSDTVVVGETVVSIGNPYSAEYAQTVTDGIISGIRKGIYVNGRRMDLLQTNAQLNPGNSGGPLINMYGQVIGINNSKIMSTGDSTIEGMGFAIPITQAKAIVDELILFGKVAGKPVIGVTVSYVSKEAAQAAGGVAGAKVESIEPGSDAYAKGLRVGDIITTINGKTFDSLDGFIEEKDRFGIGDTIKITYWRLGQTFTIDIKLVESVS